MGSPHVPSRLALVAATTAAIAVVGCLLVLSRTLGDAGGEGGGGRKAPRGDRWGFGTVPSSINHQNERPTAATATGGLGMLAGSCESKGERDCAALGNDWRSPSFYPPNNHEAASASPLIAVGHATRFLRQAFSLLGCTLLLLALVAALVMGLQLLPALEDAGARLDHRLTEACCSAILPCQPGDDDDKEANELVQALAAASRSQPRRRLLVEAGAQTSLFLLLPLLLTAAASQQKDEQHESRVVKVVRADKGVATDEPAAAEEAATMTDPPVLAPTAMVGTQTTAKMVEAGPDAATDAMLLQKPIGPPPSARPRLFHTGSGLSHGDSAPVLAEGGSSGSPLVLVGSGGAAFSSFFPSGFASLQPPGLSLPSPPLAGLSGSLARTPSGGEEAAAVLGATTQQQKEEEEEETGVNDEAIALEEEEEAGERVAVDGGDWAARTTLSLAHALQRQRVLQEECAAMGAERARLARQLEQVEGTNFLLGVEKERLADEVAHARAELARVEGLVEKGKEVMRDLEEEVEELRVAVKRAEDKAEAYHGALIKERQWHKATKEKLGNKIDEVKKERDGALATAAAVMRQNQQHGGGSSSYFPQLALGRGPPPPHHHLAHGHHPHHHPLMGPPPPFNSFNGTGGAPPGGPRGPIMVAPPPHHAQPPLRFPTPAPMPPSQPSQPQPQQQEQQSQSARPSSALAGPPGLPSPQRVPTAASMPDLPGLMAMAATAMSAPPPMRTPTPSAPSADGGANKAEEGLGSSNSTSDSSQNSGPSLSWAPGGGSIFF